MEGWRKGDWEGRRKGGIKTEGRRREGERVEGKKERWKQKKGGRKDGGREKESGREGVLRSKIVMKEKNTKEESKAYGRREGKR